MKPIRILAALLCLALLSVSALADSQISMINMDAYTLELGRNHSNLAFMPDRNSYYSLINAQGEQLTDGQYTSIYPRSDYAFFKVEAKSEDGIHNDGIIDENGKVIVPPVYADVNVCSDRWATGIKLTPSSADEKDYTFTNYSTNEKTFWRIDTVDVFYMGELVGSLTRSDYSGTVITRGDYIAFQNRAKEYVFYNRQMQRSPIEAESSSEYVQKRVNGKYVYIHQGSGQQAFTEGCTLTPDEVDKSINYDRGVVYGLQGEVLFKAAQNYDTVNNYSGDYARVSMNRLRGLIDRQGNEVIPLEYDELGNYEPEYLKYGYISAVKDGKFGFLDAAGNVTCPFTYPTEIVRNYGTFATIKNLDGKLIVLSAAVGELPEHYTDVSIPSSYGCRAFVATNDLNQYALIDIYGNTLIPFSDTYRSLTVNRSGTVALGYRGSRNYDVIALDIQAPGQQTEPDPQPAANEEQAETREPGGTNPLGGFFSIFTNPAETAAPETPAAPQADGAWTCVNGHGGNTGKFCTECGAPKPEDKAPACAGCGYEFTDGNVPKFCPNCGAKQHD